MSVSDSLALLGRTIGGHFRIEEVIGEGRHSVVYRAKHVGPDEPVAVRVLKLGLATAPASVDAFVRKWRTETSAVAGVVLADPQLVRTIELGTAATGVGSFAPFAATEWLEGKPLRAELAARGPLAIKDALALLEPPAMALGHAHRSGVAHGCLSSKTLFLAATEDGPQLRVLDLGMWLAIAEVARELPESANVFVTPWAAPEHLDPSLGDVGLATDVYALASIVLEALVGKPLVADDVDDAALRRAVLAEDARTAKALGLTLGAHVERTLERALLRDPAQRWPDVGVFWGALRTAIADDEAGVPVGSWNSDEHDTARRFHVPPDALSDALTPTGLTPTGLTPTGPTNPTGTALTPTGETSPPSSGRLPDFDDNETTEMPPFAPTVEMPALHADAAASLVRRPDDEDLTPVRASSSSKTRAAKAPPEPPAMVAAVPAPAPSGPGIDVQIEVDETEPMPPVAMRAMPTGPKAFTPNGKTPQSDRRRAAKPGDPPPEAAGSGRATGLKVTVPAPAAKIRVDDLPSVIVEEDLMEDMATRRESPRALRHAVAALQGEEKTVVQLEPPAGADYRQPARPEPARSQPPRALAPATPVPPAMPGGRDLSPMRSLPPPAPARHYGAHERRAARERQKLVLVGFVVFVSVAVATGLVLALRGVFGQ